ncbi:MAG TPA: protoglobin domain-containing protein [Caulobacteraceae bacterium]|jgi:rsbT co-antagonist protein RsbR|nr:protoglobin domain-containing protein [Caulobacteraceae bacterium]
MAESQTSLAASPPPFADLQVDERRQWAGIQSDDVARITAVGEAVLEQRGKHADAFFDHLAAAGPSNELTRRPDLMQEARRLKDQHLVALVKGDYGRAYIEERVRLGVLYSRARLDVRLFVGAFQAMIASIGRAIAGQFPGDARTAAEHMASISKVLSLDLGIIQDVMIAEREQTIARQQEAIRELSTPTLQLRDRLLVLPIIGLLDTFRAKQLTENLLRAVRERRAKAVVMDITGVATVDSKVANHLIQTVAAARLMGARVIVTGFSADVAQSLVSLGVDLRELDTVGDLQGGLEEAERLLGYETRAIGADEAGNAP